jgi:predicted nucleic acid-binding protein
VVKIVIDAYAWVELFIGSEKGKKVKEAVEQADEVFTPDTVMAEVARKYHREGAEEQTICERLEAISATSSIVSINNELALEAAKCYMELLQKTKRAKLSKPSLFDTITLATAKILKAKVITGNEHFKNLPETIWIS